MVDLLRPDTVRGLARRCKARPPERLGSTASREYCEAETIGPFAGGRVFADAAVSTESPTGAAPRRAGRPVSTGRRSSGDGDVGLGHPLRTRAVAATDLPC